MSTEAIQRFGPDVRIKNTFMFFKRISNYHEIRKTMNLESIQYMELHTGDF